MSDVLTRLDATIAARADADAATSYVAKLLGDGPAVAARKLGEEAVEAIVAALSGDPNDLTAEAADVVFHLIVLLRTRGVGLADVEAELARREGISGLAEKAGR